MKIVFILFLGFLFLVIGCVASAVAKVFFDGKQKSTGCMNLYKFDDGWKIVTRTFNSHF